MVKDEEPYDVEKFKQAAATFAENSKKPFTLFESDPQGNGRALPAIWTDTAKFKAEEEKFVAAVEKLNAAAQTGKLEEIKAATAKPVQPVNPATTHPRSGIRLKAIKAV